LIYFFIYLFLEVMVSTSIAAAIGGLATFLEILLSAIIGIFILKNFEYSLSDSIQKARSGQITQEEFVRTNASKAIGAFLLIVPGFFTDILGILLQFGILVSLFSKIFTFKKPSNNSKYTSNFEYRETRFNNTNYKGNKNDEIIDVEILDDNSQSIDDNSYNKH